MFAQISHEDKLAFFDLLDEYFESRPQHRPGGGGGGERSTAAPPAPAASSTHTNIAVPNSVISSVDNAARAQLMNQIRGGNGSSGSASAPGPRSPASPPSTAPAAAASSSASAWQQTGKGLMSKGLGKAGSLASGWQSAPSDGKGPPPPPPASKRRKGGAEGLTSSRTFGHVDTSNKLGFAKTLFSDPQKKPAPYQEAPKTTPTARTSSGLPPPPTRTVAAVPRAPSPEPEEEEGPFAEAIYAFTSNEAGDLSVREKEVVVIVAKTSDDWWTCRNRQTGEEGLVPSAYMREI